jgi:hypothetical protein
VRKGLLVVLVWLFSLATSLAEDATPKGRAFFEQRVSDNWSVIGILYPNKDRNDACYARREYKDGSSIELQKDLADGELAIWAQSMSWNAINAEKKKEYKLRVNLYTASGKLLDGGDWTYFLQNKNSFRIGGIPEKVFIGTLYQADKMALIPEGDLPNLSIYFDNKSKQIVKTLSECVKQSANRKSGPPTAGSRGDEVPSLDLPKAKGESL